MPAGPSHRGLQECVFSGNQPAEAAVVRIHQGSRVFTDTPLTVTVYDSSRSAMAAPWRVRTPSRTDLVSQLFNTSMFLTERDPWFADTVTVRHAATR